MDITFLGHSSFRIRAKSATIVTDPFDPTMVGIKYPRVSADIVTISHDHGDHNAKDRVSGVKRVVSGPGEYEISGVSIIGISTFHDEKHGKLRGKNTVYIYETDGLKIAHLGDLGHKLSDSDLEAYRDVDILMIPVGGEYTVGPPVAVGIVQSIVPSITIPMHYQMKGLNPEVFSKLTELDPFLNEVGLIVEKSPKLFVKKESLGEEQKVVVLERKG